MPTVIVVIIHGIECHDNLHEDRSLSSTNQQITHRASWWNTPQSKKEKEYKNKITYLMQSVGIVLKWLLLSRFEHNGQKAATTMLNTPDPGDNNQTIRRLIFSLLLCKLWAIVSSNYIHSTGVKFLNFD